MIASCGIPRYTITQDSSPQQTLAADVLFVGWLSLDPQEYARYGYKSAAEFQKVIVGMNDSLQRGMRTDMPGKRMAFARNALDRPPPGVELVVFFENAVIGKGSSSAAPSAFIVNPIVAGAERENGKITISATVRVFDPRLQREVRVARVTATPSAITPHWRLFNVEAVFEQCAYNLGCFITEALGV